MDFGLIQEPYCIKNIVRGLKNVDSIYRKQIFSSVNNEPPRACLIYNNKWKNKVIALNNFITRDLVAITVNLGKSRVVLCSIYVKNENLYVLEKLKELIDFCKNGNLQLIVGGDFNAHHYIWGSEEANKRGDDIMNFIGLSELYIHNFGSEPTFRRTNCATVIDLTLSTQFISHKIKNWKVKSEFTGSDHRYINYNLIVDEEITLKKRCPRKTDWGKYERVIEKLSDFPTNFENLNDFDEKTRLFSEILIQNFHDCCPEDTVQTNRKVPWWNSYLRRSRKKVRELERKAYSKELLKPGKEAEREEAKLNYKISRNKYTQDIRKSKKTSWRNFTEEIKEVQDVAKIHKLISKEHSSTVGNTRKPDGSYTSNPKETLELLTQIHFPDRIRRFRSRSK